MSQVTIQVADEFQNEIRRCFSEFHRRYSPSKGRKYPEELRGLVRQARSGGIAPARIQEITGVSRSAILQWSKSAKGTSIERTTPPAARRLEVIGEQRGHQNIFAVIKFPSGIAIELSDHGVLNLEFLQSIATLEVRDAAPR